MERFVVAPLGALVIDAASDLHRAAFAPLGERAWSRQDIAELLASPGVHGLLLQLEGRHVGFALCRSVADEAELLTIAVDPSHRRRGAGRALLGAAIEQLRSSGARTLYLEVGMDNPAARSLYEQAGFRAVGKRTGYYQRGEQPKADAVVMRLTLDG